VTVVNPQADNTLRRMVIVKIETEETRVFPTKTKTNFSICLQLISSEEYLMRNFYSYKDNREKIIQLQLTKIGEHLQKQVYTPAKLLVNSNMASQMKKVVKKSLPPIRNSDGGDKKMDQNSINTRSNQS
jgi:hypothetical protein